MYTITSLKQLLKKKMYVELLCLEGSRLHVEANELGLIINTVKSSRYIKLSTISRLVSLLKQGKFDIIHSHYSKDLWQFVPALKFAGSPVPLILTKHLGSFINKKDRLHKWIYGRVNAAVAISNVIRDNLVETTPISREKIYVIHNGIDTGHFAPDTEKRNKVRNELGFSDDDIVIGMMARFSPGKGHEEFIVAAEALNKNYNNIKYLVVGEASRGETEYEDRIKLMAQNAGLRNSIFTGFRGDTDYILNAMDIFAFPSHAEAFGIALVEAMSTGLPSVCSNSDGVLDIAVNGVTSYLFKSKDSLDLQKGLEFLINSKEIRRNFGSSARKRAIESFNIDLITDKIIQFYEKIKESCG